MSKSHNTNPNVFRSIWDKPHGIDTDYSRSRLRREVKEIVSESSGSAKDEEEDLKPFWEEEIIEEDEEEGEEDD